MITVPASAQGFGFDNEATDIKISKETVNEEDRLNEIKDRLSTKNYDKDKVTDRSK